MLNKALLLRHLTQYNQKPLKIAYLLVIPL